MKNKTDSFNYGTRDVKDVFKDAWRKAIELRAKIEFEFMGVKVVIDGKTYGKG